MEQFKEDLQIRCVTTQASISIEENFSLDAVNGNGYKSNYFEHPWYYHVLNMSSLENNAHIITIMFILRALRFICGPHLHIIGPSEARANLAR